MVKGIILSAGMGRRMGTQKLLLPLKGHTVVEEVINNAKMSMVDELLLVYGEPREEFERICHKHNIKGVYNENYKMGQSQSVIKGVMESPGADGYIFLLGDQPLAKPQIINKIIQEHRKFSQHIIVPVYCGKRGNPVLFPVNFKGELLNITGDSGGREVIIKNIKAIREIQIDYPYAFYDIDSISDYEYVKEVLGNEHTGKSI